MSRRRRQRNPLLVRIIVVSVVAHVIALPILAHFGAFDKGKKSFGTATVVMLQHQKEVAKPPPPAAKKEHKVAPTPARGADKGHPAAARKDLPQVALASGGAGTGGPTVEQGTGQGGALPPGVGDGKKTETTAPPGTSTTTPPAVKPLTQPPSETHPAAKPLSPEPPKPPPPHIPVYTEVEATYQPEPTIPDDLRSDTLDKTAVVEVTIDADGTVATAHLAQGTGIGELDDIAVRTAKTWRFKPATADGAPVEGKLRLRIEFKVE